ncbi:30S ribosomal protein S17 [Akkermansia glycaniphila]|uniref:Small ribosomal subunit protein uS17 n=1 Tax=Akkermansia glycaniphila TaxID=1679444 RepID=A0A1C7PD51_9BACT|nr:30S ribosomal protein S17 [Akkermansia glycaniphila]MBT9448553.1 30S ribosomal protein S17 [Akkermansia glycaniphila]OCA03324.1 30S ribosomal protein S17 [Akkermansia glycaniphila]SEH80504.1 ribosomal protein s17/s11 [Akkermansia glycaniphila]
MSENTTTKPQGLRKTRVGVVTSTKMDKTIVVEYVARVPHPKFKKIVKKSKKFYAHDENDTAKVGDKVRIVETRPLSRLKRWELVEVINH